MMKRITHISDTHNKHKQVTNDLPGGDILIHSGDLSGIGRKSEVKDFIKWFNSIEGYTHKIFIAGNHDLTFQSERLMKNKSDYFYGKGDDGLPAIDGKPDWLVELLTDGLNSNVIYLENSDVIIDGLKIWGSPYSPSYGYGWAFNANRGYDINQIWVGIPDDTNIVITHTPIHRYCDLAQNTMENVGCEQLYHRLCDVKPQLHFSGHIHEAYGYRQTTWGGYAFNGCMCSLRYEYDNKPITFDYDFETKDIVDFIM